LVSRYEAVKRQVEDRTAWKRQREAYQVLQNYLFCFFLMKTLFMLSCEENMLSLSEEADFSTTILYNTGTAVSLILKNQFKKTLVVFAAFLKQKHNEDVSILSERDVERYWGKIEDYFYYTFTEEGKLKLQEIRKKEAEQNAELQLKKDNEIANTTNSNKEKLLKQPEATSSKKEKPPKQIKIETVNTKKSNIKPTKENVKDKEKVLDEKNC